MSSEQPELDPQAVAAEFDQRMAGLVISTPAADQWGTPQQADIMENIRRACQAIEARDRASHDCWVANWRGRLDGATLTEVMRLRHRGELPWACHLVAGPEALDRMRRRQAIQDRLPDCAIPTGSALRRLEDIDVVPDPALVDTWELRIGPPRRPDAADRGEVIARGSRLA